MRLYTATVPTNYYYYYYYICVLCTDRRRDGAAATDSDRVYTKFVIIFKRPDSHNVPRHDRDTEGSTVVCG